MGTFAEQSSITKDTMSEKIYYGMTEDEVAKDLDTSTEQGLSPEEVQQRLE